MSDVIKSDSRVRFNVWWFGALVVPALFLVWAVSPSLLGKLLNWEQHNYDTDTARMMVQSLPSYVFATIVLFWLWRWSGWRLQGPRTRWTREVWLTLAAYLAFGVITFLQTKRGGGSVNSGLFAGVVVASLLIGFNEEISYRAFAINGWAKRMSAFWAVVAAAILFGLSHTVNLISGSDPRRVAIQVVYTACSGLMFGFVYLWSGRNLWLVAIIHGVHDMLVVAPSTFIGGSTDVASGLDTLIGSVHGVVGGFVQVGLPIMLTSYAWAQFRGRSLEDVLGLAPVEPGVTAGIEK